MSIVRLRPFGTPPSWTASERLNSERELIESSSEGSSAFREFLSPQLPEEGSKMGWPFKTDSQLCGLAEEEEVAVMSKEPQRSTCGRARVSKLESIAPSALAYASSTF